MRFARMLCEGIKEAVAVGCFATLLLLSCVVVSHAQGVSAMFVVGEDQKGIAFDAPGLFHGVGVQYWVVKEEQPPRPVLPLAPVSVSEGGIAAFYERPLGPVAVGVGAVSYGYREVVTYVDPAAASPVSIVIASDDVVSLAGSVRAVFSHGPISADANAMVWSNGMAWSARVGWNSGPVRVGVGYVHAGGKDLAGPAVFVGASF